MLTLQARVTLIAYVILMVAFFIPLKGDMDLLNKFGTSLIILLPVSLSVYIINCMVTGSKAKLGLGCNAIAWIKSLYILIIAVIVLLYNLMNSKKDTIENFYNTGSCGSDAVYGSKSYGSCIVTGSSCGSGLITYTQTASGCPSITGSEACNIECDDSSDDNTGSCGSDAVYGSAESYGSCTQIGSDCGSTAGSQAYIQTASGCSYRITYQPCNIDCLPDCEYSIATFGSGCITNNNICVERVNMVANGSNCIGSQSYTEYIGCYGSSRSDCGTGTLDDDNLNRIIQDILDLLSNGGTEYSNIDSEKIQRIVSIMTPQDIQNLNTGPAKVSFLQSVDDSFGSNSSRTYVTSNISDIEDIINTAISSVSPPIPGGGGGGGDASQSDSGDNILHNFITAIQSYGTSSDSFSYSAEPLGSDTVKYCIDNTNIGDKDCIIVGPGIIQEDTD